MGTSEYFCQEDIEGYFIRIQKEDNKRDEALKQSKSTKMQLKAALNFYLKDCLKLNINLNQFKTKSTK